MGYVAVRGGARAIEEAERLFDRMRASGGDAPLTCSQIEGQLRILHGRVLSEGGLYHPELAALAIKQSQGDPLEAAFYLRAYRSTRPRHADAPAAGTSELRLIRRISAAFKDIPGGQMLGPTSDYVQRLFRFELLNESPDAFREAARALLPNAEPDAQPVTFPKVLETLRAEGLLAARRAAPGTPFDITREPLVFPVSRSAMLATMARGETGGLLAIAYSNMRGYGDIHPTVAELRVGYLPVRAAHPVTGAPIEIGELLMTECEIVSMYEGAPRGAAGSGSEPPTFGLGYGACFGHNEVKAIAMAILDRSLQRGARSGAEGGAGPGPQNPSEDAEFVLLHIDGIESLGFATHYKMPHYVTFQSDMARLRTARSNDDGGER